MKPKIGVGAVLGALALLAVSSGAPGATRTFDFDSAEYGISDPDCGLYPNPEPPLFNRPEYGSQTKDYIVDPAGCGEGTCGGSDGSDSLRTDFASTSGQNSNELRFSWEDPTNDDSWLRVLTLAAGDGIPKFQSPTVDLRAGSSISMNIMIFATDGNEDLNCSPDIPDAPLEFALIIRETGRNLPLGENGGTVGDLEFVGLDSAGGAVDPYTPIGGTTVTNDYVFHTVTWEFTDAGGGAVGVRVKVDAGGWVTKSIAGCFTGDGVLSAAYNRGTLDGLAIRKPADDDTTVKWWINIDDVVINAPGITDPVMVEAPVFEYETDVTVAYINPTATEVKLIRNGTEILGTADPGGSPTYTFSGLTLSEGEVLTATQTVGGIESEQSASVPVLSAVLMKDDFDDYADQAAFNAAWPVVGDTTEPDRITLSTMAAASCPKSALEPGSSGGSVPYRAQVARTITGAQQAGGYQATDEEPLVMTVWVLHSAGSQNRNWIALMGWGGHEYGSGSLRTWLRIGMYNSPPANTGIYQGGVNIGWTGDFPINLDQGPNGAGTDPATRRPGEWVKFRIRVKTTTVEFLVDDVLYKIWTRPNSTDTFDSIRIGSGVTNTNNPMWYDNLSISIGDADPYPNALPEVTPVGPLSPASTSVTINDVDPTATLVKVYVNGAYHNEQAVSGQTSASVPVSGLQDGDVIRATQVISGVESCVSSASVTVYAATVSKLTVTLMIREVDDASLSTLGVGATGPSSPNHGLEFIGASSKIGSAPQGKDLIPGPTWHTITFDASTDPVLSMWTGNGILDSPQHPWVIIDSIDFSISSDDPRPGPYTVYIDSVENDGIVFGNFDTHAPGTGEVMFRHPRYSGSTSGDLQASPDTSVVSAEQAASGNNSAKIEWAFVDTSTSRWLRLTCYNLPAAQLGNPIIRLDRPVTVKFLLCPLAPVTIGSILADGTTTVTLVDVNPAADSVTVYVDGSPNGTAPGNGTSSVEVTLDSPLVNNQVVTATQTLGGIEGCFSAGVVVGSCGQIPEVSVSGPLAAGQTTVTVSEVDPGADPVKVYAQGVEIGQAPTGGNTTVDVPVTALVQGNTITATQTLVGIEGCVPTSGPVVGSGANSGLLLCVGIRESSDQIEWLGATSVVSGAPQGTQYLPGPAWQSLTVSDLSPIQGFTGNGVLDETTVVLEHLAIAADPANLDTGPYEMYIDNVTNGATVIEDFQAAAPGDQVLFRQPSYSGTTDRDILTPPNLSEVDGSVGDASSQSERIEWQFYDEDPSRWVRLTTTGDPAASTYIRDWLVLGPFTAADRTTAHNTDWLSGFGGEANVEPEAGDPGPDSKTWAVYNSPENLINWDTVWGDQTNAASYAVVYVYNHGAQRAGKARYDSDDGTKFWWNTALIANDDEDTGHEYDAHLSAEFTVLAGWNTLVFKASEAAGGYASSWRLVTADDAPMPDIGHSTTKMTIPDPIQIPNWNPTVDLTQGLTLRVLLRPACNDPFADVDGDEDVDQEDFGVVQACHTGPGGGVPAGCGCFNRDADNDIDEDDLTAFEECASGPAIRADETCDD